MIVFRKSEHSHDNKKKQTCKMLNIFSNNLRMKWIKKTNIKIKLKGIFLSFRFTSFISSDYPDYEK